MKQNTNNSDKLRSLLQQAHPSIWQAILSYKPNMDFLYFEMLCRYILVYIETGSKIAFENHFMNGVLLKIRQLVDNTPALCVHSKKNQHENKKLRHR